MERKKRQQEVDSQVDTQESTNWNFQKKKVKEYSWILLVYLGTRSCLGTVPSP